MGIASILKPEILCHPNIPQPLHGINPRVINGKEWWDKVRHEVYAKYDNHCIACGVHKTKAKGKKWLEGHEYWNINYMTGVCKVDKIEPLCHYCHNFIHSGRLKMIIGKEKSKEEVISILEHGFKILADNNLESFFFTLDLAKHLGADTFGVEAYNFKYNPDLKWLDYKLIYNKKEYKSKFKNQLEWIKFYQNGSK